MSLITKEKYVKKKYISRHSSESIALPTDARKTLEHTTRHVPDRTRLLLRIRVDAEERRVQGQCTPLRHGSVNLVPRRRIGDLHAAPRDSHDSKRRAMRRSHRGRGAAAFGRCGGRGRDGVGAGVDHAGPDVCLRRPGNRVKDAEGFLGVAWPWVAAQDFGGGVGVDDEIAVLEEGLLRQGGYVFLCEEGA